MNSAIGKKNFWYIEMLGEYKNKILFPFINEEHCVKYLYDLGAIEVTEDKRFDKNVRELELEDETYYIKEYNEKDGL